MLIRYLISNSAKLTVLAVAFLMAAVIALTIVSSNAMAQPQCMFVNGHLEEELVTGLPDVTTKGRMIGGIQGEYKFDLGEVAPSTTPGVLLFNATSVVETQDGELWLSEAGAIDTNSPGNLADLQTITGGTGAYAGATGHIFLFGNFDLLGTGTGTSDYRGEVCTP